MGWGFRKQKKFGPLRVTASSSGLTFSAFGLRWSTRGSGGGGKGSGPQGSGGGSTGCGGCLGVLIVLGLCCFGVLALCAGLGNVDSQLERVETEDTHRSPNQTNSEARTVASDSSSNTVNESTPPLPPYTIIEDTKLRRIKRTLTVRLQERISYDELNRLADHLRGIDRTNYDRTFMAYYLPGMVVGSGAWATSHFDPSKEVRILGLSKEAFDHFKRTKYEIPGVLVGRWIDERPFLGRLIIVYRVNGQPWLWSIYEDGSENSLRLEQSSDGKRIVFTSTESPNSGDYYVLDESGQLSSWDSDGKICDYFVLDFKTGFNRAIGQEVPTGKPMVNESEVAWEALRARLEVPLSDEQRGEIEAFEVAHRGSKSAALAKEELQADAKLQLADKYKENVSRASAERKYQEIIEDFPSTLAAEVAAKRLGK